MCGRYSLARVERLAGAFPRFRFTDDLPARYNIAPTTDVLAVTNDGTRTAAMLRWGVPAASLVINARIETLDQRPMFREAVAARRCAIFADGFYEWYAGSGRRQPVHFTLASGEPFAFAGLWYPDRTCAIVTTDARGVAASVHDRMPVILGPDDTERWIREGVVPPPEALEMLHGVAPPDLRAVEVTPKVNRADYDAPDCIEQLPPQPTLF
ncbi:MAG: SOS response-associated peptidase [Candidatus Eremiobacteraeota bacterium]|nr:SOS response-associated peptidase [Candidatus Eremiobacteraeota bacterium]